MNVTLRLFESQGWIQREWLDKNTINLRLNNYGKDFFKEIDTYKKFFSFYKDLTELSFSNLIFGKSIWGFLKKVGRSIQMLRQI